MAEPVTMRIRASLRAEEPVDRAIEPVPQLRIIADDLWQRVKERQDGTRLDITKEGGVRSERARRPAYLLSGLLKCGVCGGGFSKVSNHHYGCSTARNRGTCSNRLTMRRDRVEALVLDGLRHHLMQPDCVKEFVAGRAHHAIVDPAGAARMAWPRDAWGNRPSTKPSRASAAT